MRRVFGVLGLVAVAAAAPADPPVATDVSQGWQPLQQGDATGTVRQPAADADRGPRPLEMVVTQTAMPGHGRIGAANRAHLHVHRAQMYDVTFSALTERGTVGLVFSLESADGTVLARTTLPELGRPAGEPAATGGAPATRPARAPGVDGWPRYRVALRGRADDDDAVLTVTPIEPTHIWLARLTIAPRTEGK